MNAGREEGTYKGCSYGPLLVPAANAAISALAGDVDLYVPGTAGSISTSTTLRPVPFVPHQTDMKLLPLRELNLRLLEAAVDAAAANSSEMYTVVSVLARW